MSLHSGFLRSVTGQDTGPTRTFHRLLACDPPDWYEPTDLTLIFQFSGEDKAGFAPTHFVKNCMI